MIREWHSGPEGTVVAAVKPSTTNPIKGDALRQKEHVKRGGIMIPRGPVDIRGRSVNVNTYGDSAELVAARPQRVVSTHSIVQTTDDIPVQTLVSRLNSKDIKNLAADAPPTGPGTATPDMILMQPRNLMSQGQREALTYLGPQTNSQPFWEKTRRKLFGTGFGDPGILPWCTIL